MQFDFSVSNLGKRSIPSPIVLSSVSGDTFANYVNDTEYIRSTVDAIPDMDDPKKASELLEKAGPREKLYFAPNHVHAAIVTCGGLCPGLNDVIRAVTRCLWYRYGVRRITGIRYGYSGLLPDSAIESKTLDPDVVDDIHKMGGTILGSSRGGGERTADIVDTLERMNINILFPVGGDGTQKGALAIAREIEARGLKIAVVGIPKTIDNDIMFLDRSFGFETAVARAVEAVTAAHTEAHSSLNGIGLVKLMGRDSGFISALTALAVHEANFVLIPEVKFNVNGENGFLSHLEKRMEKRGHSVIILAEGAGQDILAEARGTDLGTDASGNKKLDDFGLWMKDRIIRHFAEKKVEVTLKYIDPSYIIRSAKADPVDSVYCERLGNNAVHAAMAGKTKIIIGLVNNEFVHIPIEAAVSRRKCVDPESALWRDVLDSIQQPLSMVNP